MIAAVVMGQGVLPAPATFDLMTQTAAMAVHMMLLIAISVACDMALGLSCRRLGK